MGLFLALFNIGLVCFVFFTFVCGVISLIEGPIGSIRWITAFVEYVIGYKGVPGSELIVIAFENEQSQFEEQYRIWTHKNLGITVEVEDLVCGGYKFKSPGAAPIRFSALQQMRMCRAFRSGQDVRANDRLTKLAERIVQQKGGTQS